MLVMLSLLFGCCCSFVVVVVVLLLLLLLLCSSRIFITYYINDEIFRARGQHLSIVTETQCSNGPAENRRNIIDNLISKTQYRLLSTPFEAPL